MNDLLRTHGASESQRFIDGLFINRPPKCGFADGLRELPVDDAAEIMERAAAAMRARAWHAKQVPCRYQPLPLVFYDEPAAILRSRDLPMHIVTYYSHSLQQRQFKYLDHPDFFTYASGLLAAPNGPDYLQDDRKLQREFPPRWLPGLDSIVWHPPSAPVRLDHLMG